jgi:hypothetical protein
MHDRRQLQLTRDVGERDLGDWVHLQVPQQLDRADLQRVPHRVGLEPHLRLWSMCVRLRRAQLHCYLHRFGLQLSRNRQWDAFNGLHLQLHEPMDRIEV